MKFATSTSTTVVSAFFLLVVIAVVALLGGSVSAQSTQQRQALENIDVDNVLQNKKLVDGYIRCVTEKGRCSKDGEDLKGNFFI